MKNTGRFILYLLIAVVAASSLYKYGFNPPASWPPNFRAHPLALYIHVFAAVIALLLGPLQFSAQLRLQRRQLHRWLGRAYLGIGVLVGGLSGLYLALHSIGGPVAALGFATLALCWLYTGLKAYQSIRAGDIEQHRAYMVRNFSLTMAAVTLRIYLPVSMMAGADFGTAYPLIAWLCWIPNLLLAEFMWNRQARLPATVRGV